MPLTDHEKEFQLHHPRPSSDFLAAVPIKKRRFMYPRSPSPPLELPPSPILAENKQESSEAGPSCSKAGGNSVQGSVVTSGVTTCESHDPPSVTSSDCGICEKKSEFSEPGYNFSRTAGNPAQPNVVMGKVTSFESRELSSSAPADCHITEKKPDSLETATPFSGKHALCEPCDLPSPTPSGGDISEKNPEHSEKPESPFLSTGEKHASGESCEEPIRELNIHPTLEILPRYNNPGSGSNLAANFMGVTGHEQGMVLNKAIPSATKQAFEARGTEGNFKGRFSLSEGVSVKQEDVGLQNVQSIVSDTQHKEDSSHLCLSRSNWDLNTTMDAWEGSPADSRLNGGSADKCLREVGGVQNTSLELGLKQNVSNKPRETDELLRIYDLQKNLKFPNISASMIYSNSETCLNLQLKPSFLSNLCNTSGKHDASSELPLLSLATQPVLATSGPPLSLGRSVKSEPIERDQKNTGKFSKQVKSEPCEEKEISKTTISANTHLASSGSLKTEPLEEQSQGHARTREGSSSHIGQKSRSSVPQSMDLNSVLHPCTSSSPNINIVNDSSGMAAKVPNLVNQDTIPRNDISTGTATVQDPIGIHTDPSALVSQSHASDGNDVNPLPEACESSSLHGESLPENLNDNGEGNVNSEGAPEQLLQIESSICHPPTNVTSTDEVIQNPCEDIKVVKSDEVEGNVGAEEEPCESTINATRKCSGQDEEDYKDVETRYPVLNDTVEGSSSVDVPVSVPSVPDSSKEANPPSPKENDGDLNESKVEPHSLATGVLAAESDNRIVRKNIQRTPKDHPEGDKGLEKRSESGDLVTKTSLPDYPKQHAERPTLAENYDSCKNDHLENQGATKGANDRGNNRRIIYLNPAPNCLAAGNKKSTLDGPVSSRGGRERPFNRISRDESINERSRKAENERHYGYQIENPRSDSLRIRSSRADHVLEQRNNSAGSRYSPDFSNRQARKLKNEEMQNLSRLPYQRRSPVNPRCIRRDVPDFVLLGHHDNTPYERDELRRERSLSPPLRRGGPLHLPPNQQRSNHQWSPPRRSSDGFNGPQELVRRRSPQMMRLNRMRLPHEEMIARRQQVPLNYDMEQDFPRPMRNPNRNTRRFDVIDPREIAEEEYFDHPRAGDNRIQEFGMDDEFIERRQPIRDSFRFHEEDGPGPNPRALGFNLEANEGRGGPRDFDARFRNRLGNSSRRRGGIVEEQQQGNYRLHDEQEWRDAAYDDARAKRRRF